MAMREMASQSQEELRVLRNDQAFELGFVPPVVPGNYGRRVSGASNGELECL